MATQGGFGVVLQIDSGGYLAVANLLDVDFPKFSKYLEESTSHGSPGGYYESIASGKRRVNPFPATLEWDSSDATHTAILAAFNSDDPVGMKIQDPNGDEIIQFDAHIEEIERTSKQEEGVKAKVTIHPTGPATIT